ncbi:MAG: hypothetical protein JW818_15640 [Pirellulales bacterium]|nr:hypothetical protein [Pirellulales bacterium]
MNPPGGEDSVAVQSNVLERWPDCAAADEARAFWQMRVRRAAAHVRELFARSRFRLALIAVLSFLLWAGMFWMFASGFEFLKELPHRVTYDQTVAAVFAMFFAALLVMLIFSTGVLLYGALFWTQDTRLLLTLPVRVERAFLHKFQEAVLFGSWAFLLLGSPMLLAYGIVDGAPWYYYVVLLPYLVAFTYIPAGLGAMACLAVVAWMPRHRTHILIVVGVLAVGAASWWAWSLTFGSEGVMLTPAWFRHILGRIQFSQQQLLPSWWLSAGLLEAAHGSWHECVLYLTLLVANALVCRQVAVLMAGRLYRPAFQRLQTHPRPSRGPRPGWFDRVVLRLIPLPVAMRQLLVKDLRLFRRDPVQWSQFLIFFGLLALYFLNIRRFGSDTRHVAWVNLVSFLNLSVVGLILSTLTTRFIFPMISLESRRFWILGLLPIRRETILWSKFLFAAAGSFLPCCLLVFFSDTMLRVPGHIQASHQSTCLILCLGLSGIAIGLGAKMPNLREDSPSRIAAGFGGTLNLVVSAVYVLVVVTLTALPSHFYLLAQHSLTSGIVSSRPEVLAWLHFWLIAGNVASILLGLVATFLPLRFGMRAFREMEF